MEMYCLRSPSPHIHFYMCVESDIYLTAIKYLQKKEEEDEEGLSWLCGTHDYSIQSTLLIFYGYYSAMHSRVRFL